MTFNWKTITALVLLGVVLSLTWAVNHYRDNAIAYKDQRDKATEKLGLANTTIKGMQTRQRDVAALDEKYTGELANAQATIDQLERDVATGKRRLQVAATCPKNGATSAPGMDDASSPQLTDAAQRDYFTLRERIETVTHQLAGIQDYVRTQCIK